MSVEPPNCKGQVLRSPKLSRDGDSTGAIAPVPLSQPNLHVKIITPI